MPDTESTDVNETARFEVADTKYSVRVSRSRSFDHDHGYITDVSLCLQKGSSFEVMALPAAHARPIIQALIDAHHTRDKWEREGLNWNLGKDGV